ncbi:hypothetical protein EV426DRAFT_404447 [Tirmania nivea]|nr:hypothetical protein EV426DRAFT_404447 [Tirmania nivea]
MTASELPSPRALDSLPDELLMHIISFIQPRDLVPLHKTSNHLRALTRQDPHLWRNKTIASHDEQIAEHRSLTANLLASHSDYTPLDGPVEKREKGYSRHLPPNITATGGKKIDWYEEWKWRFAPLRMEWLDHYSSAWGTNGGESTSDEDDDNLGLSTSIPPACSSSATYLDSLSGMKAADLEVRGVTAFSSSGIHGDRDMLFSPFSDGSVAVFDLRSFGRRQLDQGWVDGDDDDDWRLLGRSRPGLVSVATGSGRGSYLVGGNGGRSVGGLKTTKAPNGVVECVSVDPWSGKGWVAVEGRLIEIDLHTLTKVAEHKLPFSITALSQTSNPHPLTVCTTNYMHLYDPRIAVNNNFMNTMRAPLHQTGAFSILHSNNGQATGGEDTIFLAGRFKAILAYERRMFPKMKIPMYTGSKLSTLSSFPSPASGSSAFGEGNGTLENNGSNSVEMIVAGGEYNGHGSLELYPVYTINNTNTRSLPDSNRFLSHTSAHPQLRRHNHGVVNPSLNHQQHDILHPDVTSTLTTVTREMPAEIVRNRQSASRCKILSVDASQGARIITGDADGIIRWMERDGRQEIRQYDIFGDTSEDIEHPPQPRSPLRGSRWCDGIAGYYIRPDGSMRSEVVQKLVTFGGSSGSCGSVGPSQAGVVVWTGERLGILSVGRQRPRKVRNGKIRGVAVVDGEDVPVDEVAERYEKEMRRALERQGDELNIMKGLGVI